MYRNSVSQIHYCAIVPLLTNIIDSVLALGNKKSKSTTADDQFPVGTESTYFDNQI